MRKSPILLSSVLLLAVAAAAPKEGKLDYDPGVAAVGGPFEPAATGGAPPATRYRPCRPGPGDDNCIQLYERRVRAALPRRSAARPAMGGPIEGTAEYPLCSRLITDECIQLFDRAPSRRPARPTRRPPPPREGASTPGI